MAENERQNGQNSPHTAAAPGSSVLPEGVFGKRELFYALRRGRVKYRSEVIYQFMTAERISRCGYTEEEFKSIYLFSPEACCVIRQELQNLNFL